MQLWVLYGFALAAGVASALQSGANAAMRKALDAPFAAAATVIAISLATAVATGLALGQPVWPGADRYARVPWWAWAGGLLGAFYVLSTIFVAERVGAAVFVGLTVTAAIAASVLLDHFGWVGFPERPATLWRIVGAALMIGGLLLVARF